LQLGAQIGLLHATLTEFPQAGNSYTGTPTDATGFRLPLAPSSSGNLGSDLHPHPLSKLNPYVRFIPNTRRFVLS
jgi:hypothetical protein